jgi:alkylation response protein AidB-like acyl-CoA dehydrogenase
MIDMTLDEEQRALVEAVDSFLDRTQPTAGLTDDFWNRHSELGWLGIGIPEDRGGVGGGVVDQMLVFRELGRRLTAGPFLGTVLAAAAVSDIEMAGRLASGESRAVIVAPDSIGRRVLFDAGASDLAILFDEAGDRVWVGERAALQISSEAVTIDPDHRVQILSPDVTPDAWALDSGPLGPVVAVGRVLVAAMLVGIAEQTRDMSVEYAKTRVQYGKPIGAFQAVKHRCADMAIRAQGAWDLTAVAALRLDAADERAAQTAAAAKTVAASAGVVNAADNIQNHGAIGFTAEHEAHRFLKRARLLELLCGAPSELSDELTVTAAMW